MRRLALAMTLAALAVAPDAHAGGGTSNGTVGAVHHTATVGDVRFAGSCQYAAETDLPEPYGIVVAGEGVAAGAVLSTTVECRVLRRLYWTQVWHPSLGPVSQFATTLNPHGDSITGICVTVYATRLDGVEVTSGERCVEGGA